MVQSCNHSTFSSPNFTTIFRNPYLQIGWDKSLFTEAWWRSRTWTYCFHHGTHDVNNQFGWGPVFISTLLLSLPFSFRVDLSKGRSLHRMRRHIDNTDLARVGCREACWCFRCFMMSHIMTSNAICSDCCTMFWVLAFDHVTRYTVWVTCSLNTMGL